MKTILFTIGAMLFLYSCSNREQGSNNTEIKNAKEVTTEKLELNNGNKWKADSITNINVKNLQAIIQKYNAGADKSLVASTSIGTELQAGIDKMISECKMKGPDHEALHKWLEPLIGAASKLKKTTSGNEATSLIKEIDERLNMYGQYFE